MTSLCQFAHTGRMPHLEIAHTANLVDLDAGDVLRAAVGALAGLDEYDMSTTKARTHRIETHSVDHPDSGGSFVAVTLSVLPGRSPELLDRTSRALTQAVAACVRHPGTQVTTEIRELRNYSKVITTEVSTTPVSTTR